LLMGWFCSSFCISLLSSFTTAAVCCACKCRSSGRCEENVVAGH
jgi:hypothetical protein